MSGHTPCTCKGSRKERIKNWFVPEGYRNTNYSYFESPKDWLTPLPIQQLYVLNVTCAFVLKQLLSIICKMKNNKIY